jgi:flagellar biosynthesis/type III secretory pathway chaperone
MRMKKSILMLMVAGLFAAMPVMAAEQSHSEMEARECIQRCAMQSESIVQKIERLQNEIKKGKTTYSVEELRKLEAKLKEANDLLNDLIRP